MVENLCSNYGEEICSVDGVSYYSFPTIDRLRSEEGVEEKLRSLKFGYRAGYIAKAAAQISERGGDEYLSGLRGMKYNEARKELIGLTGIGPKVADCVLLMSMDQASAVPVDTHMFQIAAKNYMPHLKKYKSVTDKVYLEIGDHFRNLYGPHAGWAHSVLFSADLKHLQDVGGENKTEEKEKPEKGAAKKPKEKKPKKVPPPPPVHKKDFATDVGSDDVAAATKVNKVATKKKVNDAKVTKDTKRKKKV